MTRSSARTRVEVREVRVRHVRNRWFNEPGIVLLAYLLLRLLTVLTGASLLRAAFAALLGLFGSGYSLAAVLFPRRGQLDSIERAAVSGGLSLAVGGLTGFLLANSVWGLTLNAFLAATAVFNLACYFLVLIRRRGLADEELPAWPGVAAAADHWWQSQAAGSRWVTGLLALLLMAGIGGLYQAALLPSVDPPMTEFYLLGSDGKADNYPTTATPGQPLSLNYTIVNRERDAAEYQVRAYVNTTLVGIAQPTHIGPGATQAGQLQLLLTDQETGNKEVRIVLSRNGKPDRTLQLWLDIGRPPPR